MQGLDQAGLSVEDVKVLIEFVKESEPDPASHRRYLAGLLQDAPNAAEAIASVREFRTAEATRRSRVAPGSAIRDENMANAVRAADEWAKYVADRKARGLSLSGPRPPHPWESGGKSE